MVIIKLTHYDGLQKVVTRSYLGKITYCLLLWFLGTKEILFLKLYLLQYAGGKTASLAVAKHSDSVKLVEVILNFFLYFFSNAWNRCTLLPEINFSAWKRNRKG